MLALLLFVGFGLLFGYFATLNTALVSINFGLGSLQQIPMYVLVLVALAVGMLFATIFYIIKLFSYQLSSNRLAKELAEAKKEIVELTKANHKLELANTKLATANGEDPVDPDSI
ncbi:LapA family protein [Candidatus Woesebacteria bacterium]|nr:LapA family protein [Candidatus Woesebacteria bacterium]